MPPPRHPAVSPVVIGKPHPSTPTQAFVDATHLVGFSGDRESAVRVKLREGPGARRPSHRVEGVPVSLRHKSLVRRWLDEVSW